MHQIPPPLIIKHAKSAFIYCTFFSLQLRKSPWISILLGCLSNLRTIPSDNYHLNSSASQRGVVFVLVSHHESARGSSMGAGSAYEWCINRRRETYRSAAREVYGDDYCRAEVADPSDGRVTRTHAHTREPADKQLRTLFGEPRRLDRHTTVADDFWVHALCVCELIRSNIVWVRTQNRYV